MGGGAGGEGDKAPDILRRLLAAEGLDAVGRGDGRAGGRTVRRRGVNCGSCREGVPWPTAAVIDQKKLVVTREQMAETMAKDVRERLN